MTEKEKTRELQEQLDKLQLSTIYGKFGIAKEQPDPDRATAQCLTNYYMMLRRKMMISDEMKVDVILSKIHLHIQDDTIKDEEIFDIYYKLLDIFEPDDNHECFRYLMQRYFETATEECKIAQRAYIKKRGYLIKVNPEKVSLNDAIKQCEETFPWLKDWDKPVGSDFRFKLTNESSRKYGHVEDIDRSSMYDLAFAEAGTAMIQHELKPLSYEQISDFMNITETERKNRIQTVLNCLTIPLPIPDENGKTVTHSVTLEQLEPVKLERGDKIVGRYGGKGIIPDIKE